MHPILNLSVLNIESIVKKEKEIGKSRRKYFPKQNIVAQFMFEVKLNKL